MTFVVGAEIDTAEEVIGEETDRELQRDDLGCGGQQGFFLRRQENGGGGEIAFGERGGELRILADFLGVGLVLIRGGGGGADEIAVIEEREAWHDRIEIDHDGRQGGIGGEKDVGDFRVVVGDADRQAGVHQKGREVFLRQDEIEVRTGVVEAADGVFLGGGEKFR